MEVETEAEAKADYTYLLFGLLCLRLYNILLVSQRIRQDFRFERVMV